MEKHKNANLDLATAAGCHVDDAKVTKSGYKVSGFSCEKSGNVLLYFSLF
jgi:hypothetical protein